LSAGSSVHRRTATAAAAFACLTLVAACGSSSTTAPSSSGTPGSNTGAASTSSSPSSSAPVVAAAHVPTSCSAIPESVISHYTGGVASVRSLAQRPNQVSCEFVNASASSIVIINMGQGNAAEFATARAASGGGGRTITSIGGLGSSAFSISRAGVTRGLEVITDQDLVIAVSATLPLAQDEALIKQLMAL
jgi:hypothetical protein